MRNINNKYFQIIGTVVFGLLIFLVPYYIDEPRSEYYTELMQKMGFTKFDEIVLTIGAISLISLTLLFVLKFTPKNTINNSRNNSRFEIILGYLHGYRLYVLGRFLLGIFTLCSAIFFGKLAFRQDVQNLLSLGLSAFAFTSFQVFLWNLTYKFKRGIDSRFHK